MREIVNGNETQLMPEVIWQWHLIHTTHIHSTKEMLDVAYVWYGEWAKLYTSVKV